MLRFLKYINPFYWLKRKRLNIKYDQQRKIAMEIASIRAMSAALKTLNGKEVTS